MCSRSTIRLLELTDEEDDDEEDVDEEEDPDEAADEDEDEEDPDAADADEDKDEEDADMLVSGVGLSVKSPRPRARLQPLANVVRDMNDREAQRFERTRIRATYNGAAFEPSLRAKKTDPCRFFAPTWAPHMMVGQPLASPLSAGRRKS